MAQIWTRALLTLCCVVSFACGASKEAGVRVDLVGQSTPASLSVDTGTCTQGTISKKSQLGNAECGVPIGVRTFRVQCSDGGLPAAILSLDVPVGTSHYIQFHDVCASTGDQIQRGNATSKGWIWRPGS